MNDTRKTAGRAATHRRFIFRLVPAFPVGILPLAFGICLFLSFGIPHSTFGITNYPSWWLSRGVVNTNVTVTNDYAAANAGQVKWVASNACDELQANLPGGAGTNWHHVAMVFDAGAGTYYWDGALVGTQINALGAGPATVQLGSSAAGSTSEGWVGMLDEVAFYSDALTANAIQSHSWTTMPGVANNTVTVDASLGARFFRLRQ